jgi:hypothetical protein
MKGTERHGYEMLVRVDTFGEERATDFPASSEGGKLFAAVRAEVEMLENKAGAQSSGINIKRQGTTTRAVARDNLRHQLELISRTAASLAITTPGLENRFRMPRGSNDQSFINTGRAFAQDAAPLKDKFIGFGLDAAFIQNLEAAITEFEQAINRQITGRQTHVAATTAIDEALERGIRAVRQLEAIVLNKYEHDQPTLAAWQSASRILRTQHRSVTVTPPTP